MDIDYSTIADYSAWLSLAREVEPLFGPMADEIAFQEALRRAICDNSAFCIRSEQMDTDTISGGIVISRDANEVAWLAVSEQFRGMGLGRQLLEFAVGKLNPHKSIFVQTFDASVPEGKAARKLYLGYGFTDLRDGGPNPAGIPTVIMELMSS